MNLPEEDILLPFLLASNWKFHFLLREQGPVALLCLGLGHQWEPPSPFTLVANSSKFHVFPPQICDSSQRGPTAGGCV